MMEKDDSSSYFNFEDDLFDVKEKRAPERSIPSFKPRNYHPGEEKCDEETMQFVTSDKKLYKQHADYLYFTGKYIEAIEAYQKLDTLFKDNTFMLRGIKESLVWCYLKTNRSPEAKSIAEQLMEEATTFEQQMGCRYLLNVISGKEQDSENLLQEVQSLDSGAEHTSNLADTL